VQPIITEFRKYLPHLKKKKMLPFPDKINWNMDVDFPYDQEEEEKRETHTAGKNVLYYLLTLVNSSVTFH
jgi:hypothetical protein